jgi:hypothetical protein
MNPTTHSGAYTRVAGDGSPPCIVRVEIVHEETTDDRLVLKELDAPQDPMASEPDHTNAILYIARGGTSMIRMTTRQGEPVLAVYRRVDKQPAGSSQD